MPLDKSKPIKPMTLCLPHSGDEIWLGMKKRGFGVGKWNGFGGKVKQGETLKEAAIREMEEETGFRPTNIEAVGELLFQNGNADHLIKMFVFRVMDFPKQLDETEEMEPRKFKVSDIPYDEMWADDRHWMPYFLVGKRFMGEFLFDDEGKLIEPHIEEAAAELS